MPPRGAARVWAALPLEPVASLSEARAEMKSMDMGAKCLWKYPPSGGGDGVRVAVLQCNAHVACGFRVRTVRLSNGLYCFQSAGEHSAEVNERLRKNSPMTHAQTAFANASFQGTGAKPAEVRVGLTKVKEAELQKEGIDPLSQKDAEGGLAGACLMTSCVRIQCVVSRHALTYYYVLSTYSVCIPIGARNTVFQCIAV